MKSSINRRFVIAVLAVACLMAVLLVVAPIKSSSPGPGEYDAWLDWNDDGKINMIDISRAAKAFGTSGQNISKASIEYDSDWLNIADKCGQYFDVTHNLNSTDVIVEIMGRTTLDGGAHQKYFGGTDFVAGWNKTYGGTADDSIYSVLQTNDGGYLLSGYTRSFGSGQTDFWSLKSDSGGNVQWNKTYGGPYREEAVCSIQTSDGGYATVGNKDVSGYENFDVWLVKTDSFGVAQWNKTYGGGAYDFAGGAKCLVQTDRKSVV